MRVIQGKHLSVKYFVRLTLCTAVYMSVPFCIINMYAQSVHVYLYMSVIHCGDRCIDICSIIVLDLL